MLKIEYRIRPITRFIVTRWESEDHGDGNSSGGCSSLGEFDNEDTAFEVGYSLAKVEHDRLGWPIDDERITYPTRPSEGLAKRANIHTSTQ